MQSRFLARGALKHFLSSLEAGGGDFVTVYAEPSRFPDSMDRVSVGADHSEVADEIKAAVNSEGVLKEANRYGTGAAVFWNGVANKHIVLPPFPLGVSKVSEGKPDTSGLREAVENRYVIGTVLVTWGSYAIGVFDAGKLVESKTGTGYIHKEHRKGGRSEKRFARRTEEQKKDFLRKVSNRVEERFAGFAPDFIFFGGNRLIAGPLLDECRYLRSKAHTVSGRVFDVRHANREALVDSLAEISKSLVFSF